MSDTLSAAPFAPCDRRKLMQNMQRSLTKAIHTSMGCFLAPTGPNLTRGCAELAPVVEMASQSRRTPPDVITTRSVNLVPNYSLQQAMSKLQRCSLCHTLWTLKCARCLHLLAGLACTRSQTLASVRLARSPTPESCFVHATGTWHVEARSMHEQAFGCVQDGHCNPRDIAS